MFPHFGCLFEGFCFVCPLIGCTGKVILHCEFSIFFIVSCASHCLCAHGMANATSAFLTVQPPGIQKPLHVEHARVCNTWYTDQDWKGGWPHIALNGFLFLLVLITDTAMRICCAPHMCSGQAGVLGNGAQCSVGVAFKLAAGPARMGPTAPAVMW